MSVPMSPSTLYGLRSFFHSLTHTHTHTHTHTNTHTHTHTHTHTQKDTHTSNPAYEMARSLQTQKPSNLCGQNLTYAYSQCALNLTHTLTSCGTAHLAALSRHSCPTSHTRQAANIQHNILIQHAPTLLKFDGYQHLGAQSQTLLVRCSQGCMLCKCAGAYMYIPVV